MNREVTERLDIISRGEIPEGYVASEVGIIPESWNIRKLSHFINTLNNGVSIVAGDKSAGNGEIGILKTSSVSEDGFKANENKVVLNPVDIKNLKINPKKDNLIVIRKNTPDLVGMVAYVDRDYNNLFLPDLLWQTEFNADVIFCAKWLYYFLKTKYYKNIIKTLATGTSKNMPNITKENFLNISVSVPSVNEQEKISVIISTLDKAIELKEKLLEEKQKQKKGLMERFLTGKIRLRGFEGKAKDVALKNYIKESKQKNKDYLEERILSVTNKKGFILQEDQFERVVASSDLSNYKVVVNGQFAYNPSRINVGSIDLLTKFDSGLLSPMYVVFDVKEGLVKEYLFQFLKSSLFLNYIPKLLQGSVRDSLSFDALQLVKLFIPSIEEQVAISNVLSTSDKEIDLLEKELEKLKQQKKGLMQLLLSGIVRVKCD